MVCPVSKDIPVYHLYRALLLTFPRRRLVMSIASEVTGFALFGVSPVGGDRRGS